MNARTAIWPRLALPIAAAIVAAAATLPASAAPSKAQVMTGRWTGFHGTPDLRSVGDPQPNHEAPDTAGDFTLNVLSQANRRFAGLVSGLGDMDPIPVDGTVSESGNVNIEGKAADGTQVLARANLTQTDDQGSLTPQIAEGSLELKGLPEGSVAAQLVAVQQPAQASLTKVEGPYEGQMTSGTPAALTATFTETRTEGLIAEVAIDDDNFLGAAALIDYFNQGDAAGFALVAVDDENFTPNPDVAPGPSSLLVMLGTVGHDGTIEGSVKVIGSDGSLLTDGRFEFEPQDPKPAI
jgi:hypothetical protein